SLYLSAYQSELWNRTLALFLRGFARPEQLVMVPFRRRSLPFPRGLDEEQRQKLASTALPLASARLKLPPDDPHAELLRGVLAEEGLTLEQMKVRGSRELFFSGGERAILCQPDGLRGDAEADERHPGRNKLRLTFDLPRGSYATLLVKRITIGLPASNNPV